MVWQESVTELVFLAAQDLIISRRGPAATGSYYDPDPGASDSTGPDGAAVLFSTLRKRWLLLVVIGVVSAGLATLAAWLFTKQSAVVKAAVIYAGLPNTGNSGAYDPLGAATGAEMLTSVKVLDQLCAKRGLGIPPAKLANLITTNVGRSSSLINVTLSWEGLDDGISLLNELTGIFIEEMAKQRQAILVQHLRHTELALLQAKGRVDDARSQLDSLQSQKRQQLDGGSNSSGKYRNALVNGDTITAKLADKSTELIGTNKQIGQLDASINELTARHTALAEEVKKDLLREVEGALVKARGKHAPNSDGARQINNLVESVKKLIHSPDAPKGFEEWQKELVSILQHGPNGITEEGRKKLEEIFTSLQKKYETDHLAIESQRRKLEEQRNQLKLSVILMNEQIASLTQQKAAVEQQTEKLGGQTTGISATQLDEAEHSLEEAEKRQDNLAAQAINLRQLSETQLREWSVTVPASVATAQVSSNRSKLFIVVFGLCWFALTVPLFVSEWHAQTDSPQVQLARSLRVPMLAERVLEHFAPAARTNTSAAVGIAQTEVVRMLTLRIQQSCHRPGSVVLFSSLDAGFSTVPLMASIAECLAEREERVLIIDAVCPRRALVPVLNVLSSDGLPALPQKDKNGRKASPETTSSAESLPTNASAFGLSEYFSEECDDIGDLVQPTGCPGVDLIASGQNGFSREAMASSCLTELLNTCRKNYTMILIHGPAADSAADLQMLTARADGVVLTTTKQSSKDPHVREVVQDLLDLGAPLIGLVA